MTRDDYELVLGRTVSATPRATAILTPTTARGRPLRTTLLAVLLAALLLVGVLPPAAADANREAPFDFDHGNAPVEVIVPTVIPAIYTSVSPPHAGDATIVLRHTAMVTNAWYDASRPYYPDAVGVYSDLGRRPAGEGATNRNPNIAVLYASHRVLTSLLPQHADEWREMLSAVGLDPDDDSRDVTTAVGIGNVAGAAIVEAREHDGMNQLGDEGGRASPAQPYADTTGYEPVNTAYELRDPSRWQPLVVSDGTGVFRVQQFVTPQMGLVDPYALRGDERYRTAAPIDSMLGRGGSKRAYRAQADEVLAVSAGLTDRQKMTAELFDDKIQGLGLSALFAAQARGLDLDAFIQVDFLTNMAAFDAAIALWRDKVSYDAVRPVSAIRYLYGDSPVTAWGGPGVGTVDDLPAGEWRSYLDSADHPEYPSGSAGLCAAHAEASRRFFGTDELDYTIPVAAGSSRIEPGVTPAADLTLHWDTWTQFERDCGQSRLWGGVHFQPSIDAARPVGHRVGADAYAFLQALQSGERPR